MHVDTSQYEWSHGKLPRGRGYWAFDLGRDGAWTTWFCSGENTYGEAKKRAIAAAKEMGADRISVAP